MWTKLQQRLQARQMHDLMRGRLTLDSPQAAEIKVNGERLLNFSSNDYLGLANHPKMIEAVTDASKKYGVGSGASHLIIGHSHEHHVLEEELAEFLGTEKALLFSTGFMANLGVLTSLFDKNDLIIQDKLNHASLIDGGLACSAKMLRYAHNDMASLQRQLQQSADSKLMVTDGVFSMDGDLAPLTEMITLKDAYKAQLMVDDAHGFGVLGENARGSLEHFGLSQNSCDIYMATLGKALGGFGAFVAGSALLIESLLQFARSYIYTTAMPPAVAAANRMGLRLVQAENERREQLQKNIANFKALASEAGVPLMASDTPIQPVLLGRNQVAVTVAAALKAQHILAVAIRPPTVPANQARLRITLSAEHSQAQIEQLVVALKTALTNCSQEVLA
ncbi:8-amino-7-oxononanoate synthase [Kangiella sp. TOML190]|uniref:8-amino-7-oxononanoate synthase n=1 Tax=Kangiella sp. TOML190 TaxID=2931351 RepID=UPI00203C71CE|nr:8-amino-7-oxononanoate synthase [Kangiella sp. TOML190]